MAVGTEATAKEAVRATSADLLAPAASPSRPLCTSARFAIRKGMGGDDTPFDPVARCLRLQLASAALRCASVSLRQESTDLRERLREIDRRLTILRHRLQSQRW